MNFLTGDTFISSFLTAPFAFTAFAALGASLSGFATPLSLACVAGSDGFRRVDLLSVVVSVSGWTAAIWLAFLLTILTGMKLLLDNLKDVRYRNWIKYRDEDEITWCQSWVIAGIEIAMLFWYECLVDA